MVYSRRQEEQDTGKPGNVLNEPWKLQMKPELFLVYALTVNNCGNGRKMKRHSLETDILKCYRLETAFSLGVVRKFSQMYFVN